MLTTKIMHRCIKELLIQSDEDSLECLCKLLTTVGKDLESKVSPEVSLFYFIINSKYLIPLPPNIYYFFYFIYIIIII